jgi:hypothetical protein
VNIVRYICPSGSRDCVMPAQRCPDFWLNGARKTLLNLSRATSHASQWSFFDLDIRWSGGTSDSESSPRWRSIRQHGESCPVTDSQHGILELKRSFLSEILPLRFLPRCRYRQAASIVPFLIRNL